MRPRLLYENREMSSQDAYSFSKEIEKDFNLSIIFKTMSKGDVDIGEAVKKVILTPLKDEEQILYRQNVLKDVLHCPKAVEEILHTAKIIDHGLSNRQGKTEYLRGKMVSDLNLLENLVDSMIEVRKILRTVKNSLESKGFRALLVRIEEYDWDAIRENVKAMNFISWNGELTVTMSLGRGLKPEKIQIENCVGGSGRPEGEGTIGKFIKMIHKVASSNYLYLEDETLVRDSQTFQESALQHIQKHYEEMFDNLKMFFKSILFELSFYQGCYNLHKRFGELKIPLSMPTVNIMEEEDNHLLNTLHCSPCKKNQLVFSQLYELTLAIYTRKCPVTNDMAKLDKRLYIITGANQGGKSTFLRSIGIAQLLMQCGMFVPAVMYSNRLYENILTHFTRREDQQLNSGRLEEEISRMDKMVNVVNQNCMVLLNESFASTTEKEGSLIAEDITRAFYEANIDVFMVTHLFEFARNAFAKKMEHAVFLTAERKENGDRTYKMIEHEPNHTSYGLDLYDSIIV